MNKYKGLTPIENVWDWYARSVPEDGYRPIEEELDFVIGKEIMFKNDFKLATRKLFAELYNEIKHGDKKHRKWLKDKMNEFLETKYK